MAKKTCSKQHKGNKPAQNARRRERRRRLPPRQEQEHQLIDGNLTHYPAAYCKRKKGYLSLGLIETHRCSEKGCISLVGVENGQQL